MSKFTLIEVHLDGSDITANAPFSNASGEEEPPETDEEDDADDEESGLPLAPILGLLAVVALAVAAKKFLSGDVPDEIELDAEADVDIE